MALNELKSLVKKTIQKRGRHLNKAAFVVKVSARRDGLEKGAELSGGVRCSSTFVSAK